MPASRLVRLTRAEKTCLAVLRARRSATASRQKRSATAVVEENVTGRVVGEGGCAQACPMLGYQKRKRERRERPKLQRMLGTAKARAPFPRRYSGRPVKLLRGHNSTYSLSLSSLIRRRTPSHAPSHGLERATAAQGVWEFCETMAACVLYDVSSLSLRVLRFSQQKQHGQQLERSLATRSRLERVRARERERHGE